MQRSSVVAGLDQPSLRLVMQPWPTHITWTLMRIHRWGREGRDSILHSGRVEIPGVGLNDITARLIMEHVLISLPTLAKPSAPPQGDMGGQLTLDLDFTA